MASWALWLALGSAAMGVVGAMPVVLAGLRFPEVALRQL